MNIPSAKYLKNKARIRLESGKEPDKVVLVYAGICAAAALLVTALRFALDTQIAQTGGLQNIGIRSILSTADSILPILQAVLLMCLNLGYLAAMLRISRRQYASPKTLKAGAERFWPLLRSKILQGIIYAVLAFLVFYAAMAVYMLSPFSSSFMQVLTPLATSGEFTPEALLQNEAVMNELFQAMMPMLYIYLLLYIPICLFVSYRFRFTDYVLIDQPQAGAIFAMRQSRILMRTNTLQMFKLDLSFWWYYLLQAAAMVILYLDLLLAACGVILPMDQTVVFFGTAVAYLAADFAITYFLRNKVEIAYALAYDSLLTKEPDNGVVLGNIFQM